VDLEDVASVLELVAGAPRLPGQLAGLPDRDEAGGQPQREGTAQDEAAALDRHDLVDGEVAAHRGHQIERAPEERLVAQQRRDVLEDDAGLRKSGTSRIAARSDATCPSRSMLFLP
jgi:hypothetical protein